MPLKFQIDETLINAMIDSAENGFSLGGKKLECVAIGKSLPTGFGEVSGIIGIAGKVNGSILVNMSKPVALRIASAMLMEEFTTFNDDVLDSIGEVANVIGGRLKSSLANSGYPLENITLPSVIIGQNYFISHAKGMLVYHTAFHVQGSDLPMAPDRLVHVAMTLMTRNLTRTAGS